MPSHVRSVEGRTGLLLRDDIMSYQTFACSTSCGTSGLWRGKHYVQVGRKMNQNQPNAALTAFAGLCHGKC